MEALRHSWSQFLELYGSMTASSRITLSLLCVMTVGCLGYLFVVAPASGGSFLLGGHAFGGSELAMVTAAFQREGLTGYTVEGNQVRVPDADVARYMAVLAENDSVPRNFYDSYDKVIRNRTWLTTSRDMDRQWDNAKKEELSKAIKMMDDVENALVEWERSQTRGLRRSEEVTATVSIKPLFGQSLAPKSIRGIRSLIAGSVVGLKPEDVTVIDLGTGAPYAMAGSTGTMDNEALEKIKSYEEYFTKKVHNVLSKIPGATVTLNVEIDPTRQRQRTETAVDSDPKKSAVLKSEITSTSTEQTTEGSQGAEPGVASNTGSTAVAAAGQSGGTTSTETSETVSEQTQPTITTTTEEEFGGLPTLVTVAIGVPRSFYEEAWRGRGQATDPTDAELQQLEQEWTTKIQNQVANVIPSGGNTTLDPISVETFLPVAPTESDPGPSMLDTAFSLAERWAGSVGLAVLAMVSLMMMRSMVGKAPAVVEAPSPVLEETAVSQAAAPSPAFEDDEFTSPEGPTLRDRLQRAVEKDPEMAANVLRRWIQTSK